MQGPIARLSMQAGLTTLGFISWRAGIGAVILAVAFWVVVTRGAARPLRLADVPTSQRRALLVCAVITTVINLLLFAAFERTSVALVVITLYSYPAMVTLAAARVYHEPIDRTRGGALILASVGLLLVVLTPLAGSTGSGGEPVGLLLAFVAAVLQVVNSLVAARGFPSIGALPSNGLLMGFAAVCFVALALLVGSPGTLSAPFTDPSLWPLILFSAIFGAAIPAVSVLAGLRRLGPSRTAILMMLEPVVGVLLAGLLLAERPAPLQLLGGTLVIVAGVLLQLPARVAGATEPAA